MNRSEATAQPVPKNNSNFADYMSYGKRFTPYKWYKPLLAMLLAVVFGYAMSILVTLLNPAGLEAAMSGKDAGYDNLDAYTALGALVSLGSVAVFLPAVLFANRIVHARPFSSISSSRGGFSFPAFFKSLGASLAILGIPMTVITLIFEKNTGAVRFTVAGFIIFLILCPFQCIAEEYMCRGLIMQSFGSWIKFPFIPIILQAAAFAAMHPYNWIGVISTGLTGVVFGVCTFFTKGLEAGCAAHIVNNMVAFLTAGFGFGGIQTNIDILSFVLVLAFDLAYLAFIIFASKKLGWFSRVKKDDVAEFNEKIASKKASAGKQNA